MGKIKKNRLMKVQHTNLGPVQLVASPYLHSSVKDIVQPALALGQQTREILEELGMEEEIERLIPTNIVQVSNLKGEE